MGELSIAKHKQLLVNTFIPSIGQGLVLATLDKGGAQVLLNSPRET